MQVTINLVQIIVISGIVNGLVFTLLLLWKPENRVANRFLAILVFSICFSLFTQIVLQWGLYDRFPWLHWLPFSMTFIVGPAFYFYIRSLTDPGFTFKPVHIWHFAWIVFNYVHSVYHLVLGRTNPYPLFHNFTEALDAYAIIQMSFYLYFTFKCLKRYQRRILEEISTIDHLTLNWVKELLYVIACSAVVMSIFVIVDYRLLIDFNMEYYQGKLFKHKDVLICLHAFTSYWLAIGGFRQSQVSPLQGVSTTAIPEALKDYSDVIQKLTLAMNQDFLYRDPGLNLTKLSQHTKVPEKEISAALNQQLHKNFYSFINEFRVQDAKTKLINQQYDHLKILSIAYDAGFNSKASFNRVFKEFTGKSPKTYRTQSGREEAHSPSTA